MAKDVNYVSDATNFINGLIAQNPKLKQKQQELRKTWWDVGFRDEDQEQAYHDSELRAEGYSYFNYKHKQ